MHTLLLHAILLLAQSGGLPYVALTWTASVTPGATYNVYRATVGKKTTCSSVLSEYKQIASGVTTLAYNDGTPLAAGHYCYILTATSNGSVSPPSNAVNVVVTTLPPSGLVGTPQ